MNMIVNLTRVRASSTGLLLRLIKELEVTFKCKIELIHTSDEYGLIFKRVNHMIRISQQEVSAGLSNLSAKEALLDIKRNYL